MPEIIDHTSDEDRIAGTLYIHAPGEPDRFAGFTLPRSAVEGEITEEKLAEALLAHDNAPKYIVTPSVDPTPPPQPAEVIPDEPQPLDPIPEPEPEPSGELDQPIPDPIPEV